MGSSSAPRGRPDHSGSRAFTRVRLAVVGFIRRRVGSFRLFSLSSGSFEFPWGPSGFPIVRRVHSGSHGLTWERLEAVGFIRVREGLLLRV